MSGCLIGCSKMACRKASVFSVLTRPSMLDGAFVGTRWRTTGGVNINARRKEIRVKVASKVQAKDPYAAQGYNCGPDLFPGRSELR
jgi:hypothetical protein